MARHRGDPFLSNRDQTRDAATRRMPQHGAGLKKILTLRTSHKRTRTRGGVREEEVASNGR